MIMLIMLYPMVLPCFYSLGDRLAAGTWCIVSGEATVCRLSGYEVQHSGALNSAVACCSVVGLTWVSWTVPWHTLAEWMSLHRLDTIGAVWSCCIISQSFMTMCWRCSDVEVIQSNQPGQYMSLKGGTDPLIERRIMESSSTSSHLCPQAAACALFRSFLFTPSSRSLAVDEKVCRMFQVSGFQNLTNMNMMLNVQQISWNYRALDAFFHLLWHLTPCGVSTDIKMWTSSPNTLRIRDARYETSQNYRTYGTDPKYAATSIKERSIPLRDHSRP